MRTIQDKFKRYWNNDTGVAAVEFGLIVPVLAVLVFGGFTIFQTVRADKMIERSAAVTAEVISRMTTLDDPTVDQLIDISKSLIGEAADDPSYEIQFSSISNTFDADSDPTLSIDWSFSNITNNELTVDELDDFVLPTVPEGESIILVNIKVDYTRLMYQDTFGVLTLEQPAVRRPRFVPMVVYN